MLNKDMDIEEVKANIVRITRVDKKILETAALNIGADELVEMDSDLVYNRNLSFGTGVASNLFFGLSVGLFAVFAKESAMVGVALTASVSAGLMFNKASNVSDVSIKSTAENIRTLAIIESLNDYNSTIEVD